MFFTSCFKVDGPNTDAFGWRSRGNNSMPRFERLDTFTPFTSPFGWEDVSALIFTCGFGK